MTYSHPPRVPGQPQMQHRPVYPTLVDLPHVHELRDTFATRCAASVYRVLAPPRQQACSGPRQRTSRGYRAGRLRVGVLVKEHLPLHASQSLAGPGKTETCSSGAAGTNASVPGCTHPVPPGPPTSPAARRRDTVLSSMSQWEILVRPGRLVKNSRLMTAALDDARAPSHQQMVQSLTPPQELRHRPHHT